MQVVKNNNNNNIRLSYANKQWNMKQFIAWGRVRFLVDSAFQFFITVHWVKHCWASSSVLWCWLPGADEMFANRETVLCFMRTALPGWWMLMALTVKPRHQLLVWPSTKRQSPRSLCRSRRRERSIIPREWVNLSEGLPFTCHPRHLLAWETYSFGGKKRHTESSIPHLRFPWAAPVRSAVGTEGRWALGVEPRGWGVEGGEGQVWWQEKTSW